MHQALAFGPVPSRRLGRSLGVNNIPAKICTYSCVYCQLGAAVTVTIQRKEYYSPEAITEAVAERVSAVLAQGENIDYLTIVPDGEPTLDANLGSTITSLRSFGIPVAVISNASLIWQPQVRADLNNADWVSLKVDAVQENTWRRIDRGHRSLNLDNILDGMLAFREEFKGFLATETMLVHGVNDNEQSLVPIADFLATLQPDTAYVAIPTRPPAARWVEPAGQESVHMAYHLIADSGVKVEYLIGYEGDAFAATGDSEMDILSITAVHPMRRDAVQDLLQRNQAPWDVVTEMLAAGQLVELQYQGQQFYMRKLPSRTQHR